MNKILLAGIVVVFIIILFYATRRKKEEVTDKIPKIIHQTAPSDTSKWKPVWFDCQNSWNILHPDFEYRFWSDEDLDDFMKTEYPQYYNMFKSYDVNIKRFDAARYFILYHYGGIYADMDYKCQKRFFEELPGNKVSIARSRVENDEGFQNALMISPKGHPFWINVFQRLEQNRYKPDVLECTGPKVISRSVNDMNSYINPLSTDEYNPFFNHWNDSPENYKNAKAIHIHTYSWYEDDKKSKSV